MDQHRAPAAVSLGATLVTVLAACGGGATTVPSAPALASSPPSSTPEASQPPPPDVEGRLLFSRFIEATHTFDGMFTSRADGSAEQPVPLPGPEGGGHWSTSGAEIAVMTILPDDRVGTAIIAADGSILRTLDIQDPTLNLVCNVWFPDDGRLACEGWDDTDPSRGGIYAVSAVDGSDMLRLTKPPAGMADFPGDVSLDGQVVFKRNTGDEAPGALWLVPVTGGEAVKLSDAEYEDSGRFSPDGQLILTASAGRIAVVDRQGIVSHGDPTGRFEFGPDWSPDGDWIVFSSAESGPFSDLFISHPNGSNRYQVTHTPDNEITVDWGP